MVCVNFHGLKEYQKNYKLWQITLWSYFVSVAHNPAQHDQTKHVEIDRHFIKEKIEGSNFTVVYSI